ncbi:uncharacterized protein si:dkey-127k13.1 [Engraulis encrasicolus]|uniref:uncharacterized protein si:dkey-127k13.1 n=1 Tax=Engraulis encrasicolus TaxID=184585 RepID=UPI002FD2798D
MSSSDGFYSPPPWNVTEHPTVSSSDVPLPCPSEQSSQSSAAVQQVPKRSCCNEATEEFSNEQPVTDTQHAVPPYAHLQQTKTVIHLAQDPDTATCDGDLSSPVPPTEHYYAPISSDNTPLELHDVPASCSLPMCHSTVKTVSLEPPQQISLAFGNRTEDVLDHRVFSSCVSEAGTSGKTVQPVLHELTAVGVSVEEGQLSCAGDSYLEVAVHNVSKTTMVDCLMPFSDKEPLPVSEIRDPNMACPPSEPLTKNEMQTDCRVTSEATDNSAKEKTHRHLTDTAALIPEQQLLTRTDSAKAGGALGSPESPSASCSIRAPDSPQQCFPVLLQTSVPTLLRPQPNHGDMLEQGLTAAESVQSDKTVSISPGEAVERVSNKNVCFQQVQAADCCAQDTHEAPCSWSSHAESECGPAESDKITVVLKNMLPSSRSPSRSGGISTQMVLKGSGTITEKLERNSTENGMVLNSETSVLLSGVPGADRAAVPPGLREETVAGPPEENVAQGPCLSSSGKSPPQVTVQGALENQTLPHLEKENTQPHAFSEGPDFHRALPDIALLTNHKEDAVVASGTEATNGENPNSKESSISHQQYSQVSTSLPASEGVPYSFRRKRRWGPSTIPVTCSPKPRQPAQQQSSNPSCSPAGIGESVITASNAITTLPAEMNTEDSNRHCVEIVFTSTGEDIVETSRKNVCSQLTEMVFCDAQDTHKSAELNRACLNINSETSTDCRFVSEQKDKSAKDDGSISHQEHLQVNTSLPVSEGVPYSFRRKRRWGPSTIPVTCSPKQRQPAQQQTSNPSCSPAEVGHDECVLMAHVAGQDTFAVMPDSGLDTVAVTPVPEETTTADYVANGDHSVLTSAVEDIVEGTEKNGCSQSAEAVFCPLTPHNSSIDSHRDLHTLAAKPTDPSATGDPNCKDNSQKGPLSQVSTSLPVSEGVPYSFRRKRRWGPSTIPVTCSPKPRQPAQQQSSNPSCSPAGIGESVITASNAITTVLTSEDLKTCCDKTGETSEQKECSELAFHHAQETHKSAELNRVCLDVNYGTSTDCRFASQATDSNAKDDGSISNQEQSQVSTSLPVSEGVPYSFRRKRRWGPSTIPVTCSPKQQQQTSNTPEENSSLASTAHDVPVKKKRGRQRKGVHLTDVDQMPAVMGETDEGGDSDSPVVCNSAMPQHHKPKSPGVSLASKCCRTKRAAVTAETAVVAEMAREATIALGDDMTGHECSSSVSAQPPASTDPPQPLELLTSSSPDSSLEQILQDDLMPLTPLSLPDEEEEEDGEEPDEDEELPSFLERKPFCVTEGLCVWCKFRKYPCWPAVVKSVNHKNKKASIVFIDAFLLDENRVRKGLTVSLKTLKPFNCEDAEELAKQGRELYGDAVTWCLDLIYDYRIRIGCGSFSGSFIEYFANDISSPLRNKYAQGSSDLTFPTIVDDQCDSSSEEENAADHVGEYPHKKLLPDRSKAARHRANEKLVDFIVRKRGAERRLLGVISGRETSKWLRALQKASRFVVDPYLEDEEQVDKVYRYLDDLLKTSPQTMPCLASLERIPLILDVLLPEALICAIAGVEELTLEKAEEKYQKGPCISKREKQEFNMKIEQLMKTFSF